MRKIISVTEAARNFADCVNRAHYQKVTFVLLKNGRTVARLVPDDEKVCSGGKLASAIAPIEVPPAEARKWNIDLRNMRERLQPARDKWR